MFKIDDNRCKWPTPMNEFKALWQATRELHACTVQDCEILVYWLSLSSKYIIVRQRVHETLEARGPLHCSIPSAARTLREGPEGV